MTDAPLAQSAPSSVSGWLVAAGIAFIVIWLVASVVWIMMSGMASLMANDSGAASEGKHMSLIVGMLAGQIVAALAGVAGGLAFFWVAHRATLLWSFGGLLLIGVAVQAWAFLSFFKR